MWRDTLSSHSSFTARLPGLRSCKASDEVSGFVVRNTCLHMCLRLTQLCSPYEWFQQHGYTVNTKRFMKICLRGCVSLHYYNTHFESSQNLVDQVLDLVLWQSLHFHQLSKISSHKRHDQVTVQKTRRIRKWSCLHTSKKNKLSQSQLWPNGQSVTV